MKNILHKILVFLHLRKEGWFDLKYRDIPIIRDNDIEGVLFFDEADFRFKFINRRKYKGYGRPKKTDYTFSKKPKKI